LIVVIDTNIWIGELALNSSSGAAVRFYLKRRKAQLAVPEVVRLEVERNFQVKLQAFVDNVGDNYRQLLAVFGKLKEVVLPDADMIRCKVEEIFSSVGIELLEVEFSLTSARSSFLKTIEKLPPSDQNQQFKDGVLWADCLSLLEYDDVYFVTSDKAFYQGRKYENGLASNLKYETRNMTHEIKVFSSLGELLSDIKVEVAINDEKLFHEFVNQHNTIIEGMLDRNSFGLDGEFKIIKALFVTENPNVLYIEFKIEASCSDLSDQNTSNAILFLKGTGSYNVETSECTDLRIVEQKMNFILPDGTSQQLTSGIFGIANIVLGHRDVLHTVRYPLTNEIG
jgi:hypothetical protein